MTKWQEFETRVTELAKQFPDVYIHVNAQLDEAGDVDISDGSIVPYVSLMQKAPAIPVPLESTAPVSEAEAQTRQFLWHKRNNLGVDDAMLAVARLARSNHWQVVIRQEVDPLVADHMVRYPEPVEFTWKVFIAVYPEVDL